jgi:hypothetical protein
VIDFPVFLFSKLPATAPPTVGNNEFKTELVPVFVVFVIDGVTFVADVGVVIVPAGVVLVTLGVTVVVGLITDVIVLGGLTVGVVTFGVTVVGIFAGVVGKVGKVGLATVPVPTGIPVPVVGVFTTSGATTEVTGALLTPASEIDPFGAIVPGRAVIPAVPKSLIPLNSGIGFLAVRLTRIAMSYPFFLCVNKAINPEILLIGVRVLTSTFLGGTKGAGFVATRATGVAA